MVGYGILMIIFGILLFLAGLYIYTGHNSQLLLWRGYNKNATKRQLRYTGKIIMLICICPIISGIISLFFESDSFIPLIILVVAFIIVLALIIKYIKE